MAYGRYTDELADKYNQLGAYQTEENRLYGQYMDALGQYNTDRNFAFGSMQAAMDQNNHENEFDRSLFESDRNYGLTEEQWKFQQQQQAIENALSTGDYSKLKELGFDISYLKYMQDMEKAQAALTLQQKQLAMAGRTSGGSSGGGKKSKKKVDNSGGGGDNDNNNNTNNQGGTPTKTTNGYTALILNYKLFGDSKNFEKKVNELYANGSVTDADYEKFLKNRSKWGDEKEKKPKTKWV